MAKITLNYHRRHKIHHFFFITALIVVILSLLGIGFVTLQVWGATILLSLTIPQPSAVTPQPPTEIQGGGVPFPLLAYLVTPPTPPPKEVPPTVTPVEVTLDLILSDGTIPEGGGVSESLPQTTIPQIIETQPTFKGQVGIARALIFLELHSEPKSIITASFNADENGFWSWTSPRPLEEGLHTLYLTVFDPQGEVKLASLSSQFEIVAPVVVVTPPVSPPAIPPVTPLIVPSKKIVLPPSLVEERRVLFDVRLEIPSGYKEIQPGEDLFSQVSLSNIGQPGQPMEVLVKYKILDQENKVILEQEETVGVATQTSFLKIFSTKPNLAQGEYKIQVSVSYNEVEAISSDKFVIKGQPIITLPGKTEMNVSTILQILVIILAVAVVVAYFEYKQVESLAKMIHQVTEEDLKKQGLVSKS